MSDFIFFDSCHFDHWVYYELTMACSPVGLISSMDRALCPVVAKVRVLFPVKHEFFQVLLQRLRFFTLL